MNIIVTITATPLDSLWGFSDLIGDRNINDPDVKEEIIELLHEDIPALLEAAEWEIKEVEK
jgi:hypothetical protein